MDTWTPVEADFVEVVMLSRNDEGQFWRAAQINSYFVKKRLGACTIKLFTAAIYGFSE
jgi:hypothetical protein